MGSGYGTEYDLVSTPLEDRISSKKAVLFYDAPTLMLITYSRPLLFYFDFSFWVWFMVCALFELESGTGVVWELSPELLPPLVFWGMTAFSGLLHGNFHNLMSSQEV